jgi:HK97 family phage major capsid protein
MDVKTLMEEIGSKKFFREASLIRSDINEKSRTVRLSFSSEEPYERYFGTEILSHEPGSVILDRLNKGGPLLVDHSPGDQVGVIEKAYLGNDRRGRALVRFGRSTKADEIFNDVVDGIRQNVSVGYKVHEIKQQKSDSDASILVTRWEPIEISLVSIPADNTVGVGRSDKSKVGEIIKMGNNITIEDKRSREIEAYGKQFDCEDAAKIAILEGKSVDEFRQEVLAGLKRNLKPVITRPQYIGMSEKEVNDFRIVRAMNAMANPTNRAAQEAASFEFECSRSYSQQSGKTPQGFFVPPDVFQRDLTVGTDTAGGYTVATDLLASNFIELLRNKSVVVQAGATMLTGLSGDIAIPSQTGGATAYYVAEGGAITESAQTFGQLALTPKTVGSLTDISRKLLVQSSMDIENFVRNDLATVLSVEMDRAALHGSGTSNQPTGVAATNGIGSVAGGTNGLAPAYSHVVQLETEVAQDNADVGALAYITNTKVRGKLKQIFTNATYGEIPLWREGPRAGEPDRLNGYPAYATNQVSSTLTKGSSSGVCSAIFFGNWRDLIIAQWSTIDILVDPYTGSSTGAVRVVAFLDFDIGVRHAVSFAAMLDALTA